MNLLDFCSDKRAGRKPLPPDYASQQAGLSLQGGIAALVLGEPRRTPPPVDPPKIVPALELTFSGARTAMLQDLAFVPGLVTAWHHGKSEQDRPAAGVMLNFLVNQELPDVGKAAGDAAIAAAHERLAAVRAEFMAGELVTRWRAIKAQLVALEAKTAAVQKAPADALRKARDLVVRGQDPLNAEWEHVALTQEAALHANRVTALQDAERAAHRRAESELARLLDAERARIEAEARDEASRIAAEITAFVSERLERLLVLNRLAGSTSSLPKVWDWWGQGDGFAAKHRGLK